MPPQAGAKHSLQGVFFGVRSIKRFTKLKGNQGLKDKHGNILKKDQLHQDHWDITGWWN